MIKCENNETIVKGNIVKVIAEYECINRAVYECLLEAFGSDLAEKYLKNAAIEAMKSDDDRIREIDRKFSRLPKELQEMITKLAPKL